MLEISRMYRAEILQPWIIGTDSFRLRESSEFELYFPVGRNSASLHFSICITRFLYFLYFACQLLHINAIQVLGRSMRIPLGLT